MTPLLFPALSVVNCAIDLGFLLLWAQKTGPHTESRWRRGLAILSVLLLIVLYPENTAPLFDNALCRYAIRLVLCAAYLLLDYESAPSVCLYLAALSTTIANLIHGLFLTPLTDELEKGTLALTHQPSTDFVLCVLIAAAIRLAAYALVYVTVDPGKMRQVHLGRVALIVGVTALCLYIRSIHFALLRAGAQAAGQELSEYFVALQLALLFTLIFYENYQYKVQESQDLQYLKLTTESLLQNLKLRQEHDEELRRLRHDLKNHLFTIQTLVEREEKQSALAYIQGFLGRSSPLELHIQTGRPLLDALMNEKLGAALEAGVAVSVVMDFRWGGYIEDFDLCVIMGNVLDNAVEACRRLPAESSPYIEVKSGEAAGLRVVRVVNSCADTPRLVGGLPVTTKAERKGHGLGMENVRQAVARYHGTMVVSTDTPGRFELTLSFPAPAQ